MNNVISTEALIAKFEEALKNDWGYIWGTAGDQWTEAKQKNKTAYMARTYGENWKNSDAAKKDKYYMAAMYGAKWIGHMVADCSGLFWWAFKQLGGKMYHGSNTMWNKYCQAKGELRGGKRTDGLELKPGTAVFTYNKKEKNRGHVGLYIGGGWVIEAKGTRDGVIKSKVTLDKWVEWGELEGVDYGSAEPVPVPPEGDEKKMPTIRKGNKGKIVREMQEKLLQLGYNLGICGADADFGVATEKALKQFQREHGLVEDGICGPKTWAALNAAETPTTAPEPIKTYSVIITCLDLTQAQAIAAKYATAVIRED